MLVLLLVVASLTCGRVASNARIADGLNAALKDHLYHVSINNLEIHICSGALVLKKTKVVTAAHCVKRFKNAHKDLRIIGNTVNWNGRAAETREVDSIEIHPDYKEGIDYDVAVVTTKAFTVPTFLELLPANPIFTDYTFSVAGWGSTTAGGNVSPQLKMSALFVVKTADCKSSYPKVTEHMVCYKGPKKSGVACDGDSGSPVVALSKANKRFLAAIVSSTILCQRAGFEDIFVNVQSDKIAKFIVEHTK